jgi:hypothetical protein
MCYGDVCGIIYEFQVSGFKFKVLVRRVVSAFDVL